MIDGCRCRFMSQRTVCVMCVSPSACLALLRGRGRGFDSTNRECICPTASLCRERILSRTISDTIHILNSKRHRSCRNPSSHASASITPSEVQRALLFCRYCLSDQHIWRVPSEAVRWLGGNQHWGGITTTSTILLLRLLMHTSMT